MKQTDWTDRLRKRMEQQEEPVGDELWAGIEQALDDRSAADGCRANAAAKARRHPAIVGPRAVGTGRNIGFRGKERAFAAWTGGALHLAFTLHGGRDETRLQ